MRLKNSYPKAEDIPEGYKDLFTERDGQWVFTGVEGLRPQSDLDSLQTSLSSERTAHKETKDKLDAFGERKAEDVAAAFDELEVLREQAKGNGDEKVEALVQKRVEQELGPIKRENSRLENDVKRLAGEVETSNQTIATFEANERGRGICDVIRVACKGMEIVEEDVIEDILLYEKIFEMTEDNRVVTKDGAGVIPGISPSQWLTDINDAGRKKNWFNQPSGGGATGHDGNGKSKNNPWAKDSFNLTEQGRISRDEPEVAKKLKAEAGIKD